MNRASQGSKMGLFLALVAVMAVLYPAIAMSPTPDSGPIPAGMGSQSSVGQQPTALPQPLPATGLGAKYPLCTQYVERVGYHADRVGIRRSLLLAVIIYESGCRATVISGAGAVGLGQVMPSDNRVSAKYNISGRPTTAQLMDPETNLFAAANILAGALRAYAGNEANGLARYNGSAGTAAGQRYAQMVYATEAQVVAWGVYR